MIEDYRIMEKITAQQVATYVLALSILTLALAIVFFTIEIRSVNNNIPAILDTSNKALQESAAVREIIPDVLNEVKKTREMVPQLLNRHTEHQAVNIQSITFAYC